MVSVDVKDAPAVLPDGYAAVPFEPGQNRAVLRVCVVVRRKPDPVAGALVVLRDTLDAQVYLGCVVDAAGAVQRWVELWVQSAAGLAGSIVAQRETLTNAKLDERWGQTVAAMGELSPGDWIHTGWETEAPPPMWIDLEKMEPVHPADESGRRWVVCRDDAKLTAAGLPAYGGTLYRYLYVAGAEGAAFVAATPDSPAGPATKPITEVLGGRGVSVPLNSTGGYTMVRTYLPVAFEQHVGALTTLAKEAPAGAAGAEETEKQRTEAGKPSGNHRAAVKGGGTLFLGQHGRWGRLLESFHLKLRVLADALEEVHALARKSKRPLLNLSPESFRVSVGEGGRGLPVVWTARAKLVDPGDAVRWVVENSDERYFLPGRGGLSIYRPALAQAVRGRASVRIRQVLGDVGGTTILEGTFSTYERLDVSPNDLVWLRVNLGSGPVDLYARLEVGTALAAGEWRFRTVGRRLPSDVVEQLKAAAGVPITNAPFEQVPHLSTPCDLYALGVLGVRTLLVNGKTTLPVALDELLSLARQVAMEHDTSAGLRVRIAAIFEKDVRWSQSLGPQRLTDEALSPQEAMDLIPADVWWDTLAFLVRMFPGVGPDSRCKNFGDAPAEAPQVVFDRALEDIDMLLLRTRSLIVIDWRYNREIHSVIRRSLTGMGSGPSGGLAGLAKGMR